MSRSRVRTAGVLGGLRFAAIPMGIVSQGLAARLLGVADFGRYAVLLSVANTLGLVMGFGLADGITREVAARSDGAIRLGTRATLLTVASVTCVWAAAGSSILDILDVPSSTDYVVLVGVGGAARAALRLGVAVSRGVSRLSVATLGDAGLVSFAAAVPLLALWLAGVTVGLADVLALQIGAVVVSAVAVAAILAMRRGREIEPVATGATPRDVRWLVRRSTPLLGNQVAQMASSTLGLWVISASLESGDAARFAVAARIAALASIPGVVVQFMAAPDIASGWADGVLQERMRWLRRGVFLSTAASALYVIGVLVGSRWVTEVVFGLDLRNITLPLAFLGLAQVVNVGSGPCGNALIMAGFEGVSFRATLAGAVFVIIAIGPAVEAGGVLGAAAVTGGGMLITNVLNARGAKARLGLTTWARLPTGRSTPVGAAQS